MYNFVVMLVMFHFSFLFLADCSYCRKIRVANNWKYNQKWENCQLSRNNLRALPKAWIMSMQKWSQLLNNHTKVQVSYALFVYQDVRVCHLAEFGFPQIQADTGHGCILTPFCCSTYISLLSFLMHTGKWDIVIENWQKPDTLQLLHTMRLITVCCKQTRRQAA